MLCSGVKGIQYFEGTYCLQPKNRSGENGQGVVYVGKRRQELALWRKGMAISHPRNKKLQGWWRQYVPLKPLTPLPPLYGITTKKKTPESWILINEKNWSHTILLSVILLVETWSLILHKNRLKACWVRVIQTLMNNYYESGTDGFWTYVYNSHYRA